MELLLPLLFSFLLFIPAVVLLVQGIVRWCGIKTSELFFSRLTIFGFMTCGAAATAALVLLQYFHESHTKFVSEAWFQVDYYSFRWAFVADRLALIFCILSAALTSLVGVFSRRYLHRDPGFYRFYFLLTLFGLSAFIIASAGTLEVVFFGWELIGLASALLVSFFNTRPQPLFSGLRAYITYRVCDIGLLLAVILSHQLHGTEAFEIGKTIWWLGLQPPSDTVLLVALTSLLIFASIGKSALYPLGDWLPRAMEGPTPSSAIFYGAISVHLGVFLLLRIAPLLEASSFGSLVIIILGVVTALHGTFVGRVQTDIKSILAYASMTQIGIIVVEIGFGFYSLAVVHMIGHTFLRTLQILRSPNILHDRHHLEQGMGEVLPRTGVHLEKIVPRTMQPWLYRAAQQRGYMDTILVDYIARTFLRLARSLDNSERKWKSLISSPELRKKTKVGSYGRI